MADSVRNTATEIVRRLQSAGFAAYWVGGCVRDFLLGREPGDYDVATNALPDQIEKLFPRSIPVGRKFGVIIVVEGAEQFEVATFRSESDYQDGRRPEQVSFGDPRADAMRRDFTINGIFFDPVSGKSHDWVGGEADLKAGVIRTIGAPEERFAEDHLRMLRAVRFAARFGFEIEPKTFAAIQAHAEKIKIISAERIRDELLKLFATPNLTARDESPNPSKRDLQFPASRGLELLRTSGLLEHILPELAATNSCDQSPDFHPEGNVFKHLRLMLEHVPADADPMLSWAALMHDIAKPRTLSQDPKTGTFHFYEHEKVGAEMTVEILERLRFPRKQIEQVSAAVLHHMQFKDVPRMRKSTLRRMLMRETFPLELQLHRLDCLGSHGRLDIYDHLVEQSKELEKMPDIRPALVNGEDLAELGIKPGPQMGELLAEIREKQLSDELKTKAAALSWLKSRLAPPS